MRLAGLLRPLTTPPRPMPVPLLLRYLIPGLVIANLLVFARLLGWIPGIIGDMPDPSIIQQQINPEQVRIVPGSAEGR